MTYFWYSYSLYIVLGILFIIWILCNTWIINTIAAIFFVAFIYESHDSYVANKLCSCFPILKDAYDEMRAANGLIDEDYVNRRAKIDEQFENCRGEYVALVHKNSTIFVDENGEPIVGDSELQGQYVFNPNFKNIVELIEKRCPDLVRKADITWVHLLEE